MLTLASNDPARPALATPVVFHVGSVDVADMDIDPDVVNLGGGGAWMSAFVELPGGYDPGDIVLGTVAMNGVAASGLASSIGDFNENGIPDRQFKFPLADVVETLGEGDSIAVTTIGEIEDTIWFTGTEYIRTMNPRLHHPNGGQPLVAGSTVAIQWSNPPGLENAPASLWYSGDAGETWSLISDAVSGQSHAWQVPLEPTTQGLVRIYVYQSAQRILGYDTSDDVFPVTGAVTAVETEQDLPVEYALRIAGANPVVHNRAQIELAMPVAGPVDVKVYDVRGGLVRELAASRTMPAGRNRIEWDNRNRAGDRVGAGIYFIRADAGGKSFTARVSVLR
jgi:hypothetical protein